jgi:type II secretory pathway component PulK
MKSYSANNKGLALMMVLWVLILLGALATEFAYSMRTEVNATKNYKEDIESYYLAKAGINMGIAELYKNARFHSIHPEFGFIAGIATNLNDEDSQETLTQAAAVTETQDTTSQNNINENPTSTESFSETGDDEPEFAIIERTDLPLGNGTVSYKITDENGKININTASREVLVKTLEASGVERGDENSSIADSILDWIDNNQNHRLNGAESEYYLSLDPPYEAKNDVINSLDELLRIRGMTEEILYGSPDNEENPDSATYLGLINFLTVQNVKVFNPNTADPAMLPIFFTDLQIGGILGAKEKRGYYNNTKSTHFRVESTGYINGSNTKRTIVAILEKFGEEKGATLMIRYWNDNALRS